MEEGLDVGALYKNQEVIAENQVIMDKKFSAIETALGKALEHLTPKEQKELESKGKHATVADVELALQKQKEIERQEKANEQVLHQLQTIAEQKLDTAEEAVQSLFQKAEIEYDEDAKEDFDEWSRRFIDKGLAEQKEAGSKKFDWKKFQDRMESKFQKSYRIKVEKEDEEEDEEEEKPKGKIKSPKALTGLNDEVGLDVKPGSKFDKMMERLEAHNRVTRGTPKAGDSKMSLDELIKVHRVINQTRNKQGRMAEVV